MVSAITVGPAKTSDLSGVELLYPLAFPDEDCIPLINALWTTKGVTMHVAEDETGIIGHIALTECRIDEQTAPVALLGPLAVHPDHQKQGLGKALMEAGLTAARANGIAAVYLLGDPNYYTRHGFSQEDDIIPPYPVPEEWRSAWQSRLLGETAPAPGTLVVPEAWQDPVRWGP